MTGITGAKEFRHQISTNQVTYKNEFMVTFAAGLPAFNKTTQSHEKHP